MLINRLILICFAIVFVFASCQKEFNKTDLQGRGYKASINFTPAKTSSELSVLRIQKSANIIRTLDDFDSAVLSQSTPLSMLSEKQVSDFRNSLSIKPSKGVVSLQYSILKSALSYDDFADVMVLFGIDIKQGFWGLSNDPTIQAKLNPEKKIINSTSSDENNVRESLVAGVDIVGYKCMKLGTGMSCVKAPGSLCDGCN